MVHREESNGRGLIETGSGAEVPVYYHVLIERSTTDKGVEQESISGRLSVSGDPWLESSVIDDGRTLVLQDGRRLRVQVEPAGRGSMSLPFRAEPEEQGSPS